MTNLCKNCNHEIMMFRSKWWHFDKEHGASDACYFRLTTSRTCKCIVPEAKQ